MTNRLKQHTIPDDGFLADTAKVKVLTYDFNFPAGTVWLALKDADTWTRWLDIDHVEWTSPKPLHKGATRTVMAGKTVIEEVFPVWEENKEMGFYFSASTLPIKQFAESYRLQPTASGCKMTWTFRMEANPILKFIFNRVMVNNGKKGFPKLEAYIEANPEKFNPEMS